LSMPVVTLRPEFRSAALKGTAIELATRNKTGATQIPAAEFLNITYPSHDLIKALQAIGPHQDRPVVLIGERGIGKSHLMAALHHAGTDPASTQKWLTFWAKTLGRPELATIALRSGMQVISEKLTSNTYKFLWDLLLDNHPKGQFIRGKWDAEGKKQTNVPSEALILELLQHQPVMLLLDEFQTWFDGQTEARSKPHRTWAFNFIQTLSEIAKNYPDLLVLVISVRNGKTDAYQQVRRVAPLEVDFKSTQSKADRRRLLLHRLFENRINVPASDIEPVVAANLAAHLKLKEVGPAEHERWRQEYLEFWPFAPQLIQTLEDQILVATQAQDTRDLIRILASLFKSRGKNAPVLTPADFDIEDDASGIGALIDSVANDQHKGTSKNSSRQVATNLTR
jgi:predicted AAA+ superfamily ATPase